MVGKGVLTKTVPGSLLDPGELQAGTSVQVARIINTPIGLRFRLMYSTRWIGQDSINCEYNPEVVVDYVKIAAGNIKKTPSQNVDCQTGNGLKPCQVSAKPVHVSNTRHGSLGRTTKMDKKDLKAAISGLTTGDSLSVTFLSTMPTGPSNTRYDGIRALAGQSVEFTLVGTKKGRGKGGSQLMVLKAADGSTITTGTPHSDVLVNITTPAGMVGHESESAVPRTYETNAGRASELKAQFKGLVGTVGASVRIESSEADYNGTFTVRSAELLRGRHGQVKLMLESGDRTVEVWSYRHSGVVTSFEILGAGSPAKETSDKA